MKIIEPSPQVILVKLDVGTIPGPEKLHNTYTSGLVVAVNDQDKESLGYLVGRIAYWRGFKDDCRLPDKMALIDLKDILGSSYESA